jgi:hypothetical protein
MRYAFKDFVNRPAIGKVTVRQEKQDTSPDDDGIDHVNFALRSGKTVVQVNTSLERGPRLKHVQRTLLETIAGNLSKRSIRPVGAPSIAYHSPLVTAKPTLACAVYNAGDFRRLFLRPAAPFAREEISSAVGRLDFSIGTGIRDPKEYAYVHTMCERGTGNHYFTDRHKLRVEVFSYMAPAAAEHYLTVAGPVDGGRPLSRSVGDGSYCVTRRYAWPAGALVFRKGRFVVILTMTDPDEGQNYDPGARCTRMAPVAEQVADRLK